MTRPLKQQKSGYPSGYPLFGGSPGARLHHLPQNTEDDYGVAGSQPVEQQSTGLLYFIFRVPAAIKNADTPMGIRILVARQGLEPWTHALKGRCSTN